MAGHSRTGAELTQEAAIPLVPWLDDETAGYLRRILALLAQRKPETYAAILFGSVSRHHERRLDDPHPSDVDVLVLFHPQPEQEDVTPEQRSAISWAMIDALQAYPNPPREVQITGALMHFVRWDPSFVENIAREGILLWARGPLPPALAAMEQRRLAQASS